MPATVATPARKTLRVYPDDALWLARAVEREGAPRDLVAQTLVNRWAWLADQAPGMYPRLQDLVRAYAQPVNPAWFPGGSKFQASYDAAKAGDPHAKPPRPPATPRELAQLEAAAEQRRDVHSTRTKFSPDTLHAVSSALSGPLEIPPGALEYAIPGRPFPVMVPPHSSHENVIYGDKQGRGLDALYSILQGAPDLIATRLRPVGSGAGAAVLAVLGIGAGAGLSMLLKRRRK